MNFLEKAMFKNKYPNIFSRQVVALFVMLQILSGFGGIYYLNKSLHLVRKYARIFVRGHYLFQVANRNL